MHADEISAGSELLGGENGIVLLDELHQTSVGREYPYLLGVLEADGIAVNPGDLVCVDPATGKVCAESAAGAIKLGHAITKAATTDATVCVRLLQGLNA